MPEKNLFKVLNLDAETVKQLLELTPDDRKKAIDRLGYFYNFLFHPDVTGSENERIKSVGIALRELKKPDVFAREARSYVAAGGTEGSVLAEQANYASRALREVRAENKAFSEKNRTLETDLGNVTSSLDEFRTAVLGVPEQKQGRVYLRDLPNFAYYMQLLIDMTKNWYVIDDSFGVRKRDFRRDLIRFAGGLEREYVPAQTLARAPGSTIIYPGKGEDYNRVGVRLKPYLEPDMFLVMGDYPGNKDSRLQIFGRVLKIEPNR